MKYNLKNLYLILILLLQIVIIVLVCLLLYEGRARNAQDNKLYGLQKEDYDKLSESLHNKKSSGEVKYEIVDFNNLQN